ncbi:15249_t:CDS:1 [Dentiscutata erythropus]|uniref:15249_t:CDS:1 n=1 Tax=Dentiscutata erythropus TaxID=1348616 RepID=A0A9N9DKU0_9GLOM|nr:15249_t:CDS:1 [Dentiscutata erythropus]
MWLYFCSYILLIIVNWYLRKQRNVRVSFIEGDNSRNVTKSSSLKRRSSIRKSSLKYKGSKGSLTDDDEEMSENDEKENSNNLNVYDVHTERVEAVHQDDVYNDDLNVYNAHPIESVHQDDVYNDDLNVYNPHPERTVEVIHQDDIYNDEYVIYGNAPDVDDIESNVVRKDAD